MSSISQSRDSLETAYNELSSIIQPSATFQSSNSGLSYFATTATATAEISTNYPYTTKQLVATTQRIGIESSITELTSGGETSFTLPDIINESSVLEGSIVPTASSSTNTLSLLETSGSPIPHSSTSHHFYVVHSVAAVNGVNRIFEKLPEHLQLAGKKL